MILTVDKENKNLVAEFQDKDSIQKYECVVSACKNPVCTCGDVDLELLPISSGGQNGIQTPHRNVEINIDEKSLDFRNEKNISTEDMEFAELFLSKLNEKDFHLLSEFQIMYKHEISEKATPASIDAHFDFHEVENNGLMSSYNDVLPFGDQFPVLIDGEQCLILDQYCLLPNCSCTDPINSKEIKFQLS